MTISPANPQFLQPSVTAPAGSPQTQFVATPDTTAADVKAAAEAAIAAYAAAADFHGPVPPAGVYVGPQVSWSPAAALLG